MASGIDNKEVQEGIEERTADKPLETWDEVLTAIQKATHDAFHASPSFDVSSPSTFQTYWRDIFTQLQSIVESDPGIPEYLTSPPVKHFVLTLFDEPHGSGCPCGLPYVVPSILLENESGVTKNDLLREFTDYMYGEELPEIFTTSDDLDTSTDDSGVLMFTMEWISSVSKVDGKKVAHMDEFDDEIKAPNVFIFCCGLEAYARKMKTKENREGFPVKL